MKKGRIIGIIMIVLLTVSFFTMIPFISKITDRENLRKHMSGYTEIIILRDKDFTTLYNFSGSGIETDPFKIENLQIISNKEIGIHISGTTCYFQIINCTIFTDSICISLGGPAPNTAIIRNCNLSVNGTDSLYPGTGIFVRNSLGVEIINNTCIGPLNEINWPTTPINADCMGIDLRNSPNSKIFDNKCTNWLDGIGMEYSDYTQVSNNNLSKNRLSGVYAEYSEDLILSSNICHNNTYGINVMQTYDSIISYNSLFFNVDGIFFDSSFRSIIFSNYCNFNSHSGLRFYGTIFHISVTENTCSNNSYGMTCFDMLDSNISKNTFQYNSHYGLELIDSSLFIYQNNFIGNCYTSSLIGHQQAIEYGLYYQNNFWFDTINKMGNYWSDLIWDETAIYYIDGSNNTDLFPLQNPVVI